MIHQKRIDFQDFTTQSIFAVTSRRSGTVQNRPVPALDDRYLRYCDIAYLVIGANGIVRGKKVTSLARWPPNPSRCWALTWRTIGPMEDYWAFGPALERSSVNACPKDAVQIIKSATMLTRNRYEPYKAN